MLNVAFCMDHAVALSRDSGTGYTIVARDTGGTGLRISLYAKQLWKMHKEEWIYCTK